MLIVSGYFYYGIAGCGGASKQIRHESSSIPIETPLSAYNDGNPMDSFGRFTNWPKEPGFKDIEISEKTRKLPVPDLDKTTLYYQFIGRLISGKLMVDAHQILPAALLRLKEWKGDSSYGCPGRLRGESIMPAKMPVEFIFWQALDDMFRNSPLLSKKMATKGTTGKLYTSGLENQDKAFRGRRLGEWVNTIREVMVFRVTPNLECKSQKKFFKLVTEDTSDDNLDRFQWKHADLPGINGNDRGEISAEMTGSAGEKTIYTLKLHIGIDVDALYGNGDTYDWVLQCESDNPVFASEIKKVCFELQSGEKSMWKGMMCNCSD